MTDIETRLAKLEKIVYGDREKKKKNIEKEINKVYQKLNAIRPFCQDAVTTRLTAPYKTENRRLHLRLKELKAELEELNE